jgi:hypothetical protein
MGAFGLVGHDGSLAAAASASHDALLRPLTHPIELCIADLREDGELLGAFQRRCDARTDLHVARRATGGASVRAGSGIVQCVFALESPSVLTPAREDQILNRWVRPFLAALTKVAAPAHYFGRDWISVAHRPAASIAFAHTAATGRTVVEVFVGTKRPFAAGIRGSFLGKEPVALDAVARAPVDVERLRAALVAQLGEHHGLEARELAPRAPAPAPMVADDPPWNATIDEAIGPIGAGRDRTGALRLGGELMASTDAVAELESRLAHASADDLGTIVAEAFTARTGYHPALFGVRSMQSLHDVLAAALRTE